MLRLATACYDLLPLATTWYPLILVERQIAKKNSTDRFLAKNSPKNFPLNGLQFFHHYVCGCNRTHSTNTTLGVPPPAPVCLRLDDSLHGRLQAVGVGVATAYLTEYQLTPAANTCNQPPARLSLFDGHVTSINSQMSAYCEKRTFYAMLL